MKCEKCGVQTTGFPNRFCVDCENLRDAVNQANMAKRWRIPLCDNLVKPKVTLVDYENLRLAHEQRGADYDTLRERQLELFKEYNQLQIERNNAVELINQQAAALLSLRRECSALQWIRQMNDESIDNLIAQGNAMSARCVRLQADYDKQTDEWARFVRALKLVHLHSRDEHARQWATDALWPMPKEPTQ